MKNILALFFNIILSTVGSYAQEQSKYEVGFQGGLVLSTANGAAVDFQNNDALSGFGFGFNVKRNLYARLALKLGINYEQRGWAYRDLAFVAPTPGPGPGQGNIFIYADVIQRLSYINIPILAEYSFGKKFQVLLNAGPFVGLLLKSRTTIDYKDDQYPDEKNTNNNIKSLNAGVATGLGLSYPITPTVKVGLQGSHQFGLVNIGKNYTNSPTKLNAFSFTTGMTFSL